MQLKTKGPKSPMLAIGIAAAFGGCATPVQSPPDYFNQPPVIEGIFAFDSAFGDSPPNYAGGFSPVQLWANPADPNYPNAIGETGTQNAADVSPMPPSYGGIVVTFNQPLDGSKFGMQGGSSTDPTNDLGTYCSDGSGLAYGSPAVTLVPPFVLYDVDNNRPLIGSICYNSGSPQSPGESVPAQQYPALTYVVGAGSATNALATPFTCQAFTPASGDPTVANVLDPSHHYQLQFNSSVIYNDNGQKLTNYPTTPASTGVGVTGWSSGAFSFSTSGFDLMAAGYQDPVSQFYSFVDKPFKGYLKDCFVGNTCSPSGLGEYYQPDTSTPFFLNFTLAVAATPAITVTREDGSPFAATVTPASAVGGDPRQVLIIPGDTWQPGEQYVVTIPSTLTDANSPPDPLENATTSPYPGVLADGSPITFNTTCNNPNAAAGSTPATPRDGTQCTPANAAAALANINVEPASGSIAQYEYGQNGAAGDQPSWIVLDYNAPIDATKVNTTNIQVTAGETAVQGTVSLAAGTNGQEIDFIPNAALASNTSYKISVTGLTVDPSDKALGGKPFPAFSSSFSTATPQAFEASAGGAGAPFNTFIDGASIGALAGFVAVFSRPMTNVNNSTVAVQEVNADGTPGTVLNPDLVQVAYTDVTGEGFAAVVNLNYSSSYPLKCGGGPTSGVNVGQTFNVILTGAELDGGIGIQDTDEAPPASVLSAQGCTVSSTNDCENVLQFTETPFSIVPDANGNSITYAAGTGGADDTLSISFNASLDETSTNNLLAQVMNGKGFITLLDPSTKPETSIPLTCTPLTSDSSPTITCNIGATLQYNHTYSAAVIVDSTTPILIAATTTLPGGEVVAADQTTCQFSGSVIQSFTTGCAPTSPRAPPHKAAAAHGHLALK